jgi:hypothetical protein
MATCNEIRLDATKADDVPLEIDDIPGPKGLHKVDGLYLVGHCGQQLLVILGVFAGYQWRRPREQRSIIVDGVKAASGFAGVAGSFAGVAGIGRPF